ncbi:uncharacterized protein LOC116905464 isoform X2 [Rattus rattus]|nr:uncharacterized protein LOC116905464 isoform X2 [Rattus rattus]
MQRPNLPDELIYFFYDWLTQISVQSTSCTFKGPVGFSKHQDLSPGSEWEGGCLLPCRIHTPEEECLCVHSIRCTLHGARMEALMRMEVSLLLETLAVTAVGNEPWANNFVLDFALLTLSYQLTHPDAPQVLAFTCVE